MAGGNLRNMTLEFGLHIQQGFFSMKIKQVLVFSLCVAAAAYWTGCATFNEHQVTERTGVTPPSIDLTSQGYDTVGRRWGSAPAETKVVAPAPKPAPAAPPIPAKAADWGAFDIKTGLVNLTKKAPAEVSLGDEYSYDLTATAVQQAGFVVITDEIPKGATYIRSEPPAQRDGNLLTWKFPAMEKGEAKNIKVWLKADNEGELRGCSTVTAVPRDCLSTFVGKPALAIQKTGPATAKLGQDVTYTILVSNKGSSVAKNVVVTDPVPEGMTHASGQSVLSFNVGDLAPNQSKTIPVTFKAARRGKVLNTATAASSNAGKVSADAPTVIVQQLLQVAKTGIKEQYLGRNAAYEIVVSNPGDVALTGVVVTDNAPAATKIVSAPGAQVNGNQAVWRLASLPAGGKQSFNITLTTMTPGTHENGVSVATAEGLSGSSAAATLWRGVAGLLLQMVDTVDPIQVGDTTEFIVTITNQGTAEDGNIKPTLKFPAELQPLTASGATAGQVQGQTVTFGAFPKLAPKQEIKWTVRAKGLAAGDARTRVEYTSDLIKLPVAKEESTHVY
jgi:uncharacterized repeat protein (TIGR01451 family)